MTTRPVNQNLIDWFAGAKNPPGKHCSNRMIEWGTTSMMLGIALCIFLTPNTVEIGAFRFMIKAHLTAPTVAVIFIVVGTLRVWALYANGNRQPHGAWARALGAAVGAFMWFQMFVALILLTQETGTLSIGIPTYAALTAWEVYSCYRAAYDERRAVRST